MADPHLLTAALIAVYALGALFDGVWLHLVRYRLHLVARREHALHTARALLFPALLLLVLWGDTSGPALWLGLALVLADFVLVAWDAAAETRTRSFQHGLPAGEAALHTILHAVNVAALASALAARPRAAWSGTVDLPAPDGLAWLLLAGVLAGAVVVALLHALLLAAPRAFSGGMGGRDGMPSAARLRGGWPGR